MANVSNWNKFVLLLWKNWKLQKNHKVQLFVELFLPVLFSLLLVLIRTLVIAESEPITTYPELNIDLKVYNETNKLGNRIPFFWLYYSPQNDVLDKVVGEAAASLGMQLYQGYKNAADLENAMMANNAFAGIQFDQSLATAYELPKRFDFVLRFPSELRTNTLSIEQSWLTMRLFPSYAPNGPRNKREEDGGIPVGYLREGFLAVQHAVSMAYLRQISNNSTLPSVKLQRYPYPSYIDDPLLQGLGSIMSLIILLCFMYPCTYIVKYVTTEKEFQLKEVMKIMGLSNWLHWTAWFVKSFITLTISAIMITTMMKIPWVNNVSVLTHTDFTVLVFFFIVYNIAMICFCFMLATFFSKASTAAAVSGIILFVGYIPYTFTYNTYADMSLGSKLGWSLSANTAMGFGFQLILAFEATGEGLQWSNLFSPVNVDDNFTVGYIIVMMLISAVIYMLICLYVEQIFPGDFGVPRKWNFIFMRSFWCGQSDYMGVEDSSNSNGIQHRRDPNAFEAEPEGKNIGLQIRNLKKRFGDKMAVNGMSINMFEDEITVLLGHNGAGKTTTISMLTGMFPPTAGTAIINGSDIRTNIDGARMSMGICPQHNVLFGDMSVSDHLRFFSRMKGLTGAAVEKEVEKYIKLIELENKANVMSSKLSGGMKRKLSVCCALCGDAKVVLCDEPSSGMDPAARRQMWDLLQQEKIGRTLLLTTHFMDEADVLGDRIAIMCDGELNCYGTSFFLKKQYGSGYRLICVKRENCEPAEVTALLNLYVPGIQPDSDIGAELSYKLPDSYSSQFEKMFGELEQRAEEVNLDGYGVGITSLEEVFMKVGAEKASNGERKQQSAIMNGGTGYNDEDNESIQSDGVFSEHRRLLSGMKLWTNQWHAMLLKKLLYTWRNKLLFVIQNLIPIFIVCVTILSARNYGTFQALPPIDISLQQYPEAVTILDLANVGNDTTTLSIAKEYELLAKSFGPKYSLQQTGAIGFEEYILELGKSIQVRINSRYLAAASIADNGIIAWLNNQPLHTAPLTLNLVHNALARALIGTDAHVGVTNWPLPYTTSTLFANLNLGKSLGTQLATNICFCMCFVSAFYIIFPVKERESRAKLLQFVSGVRVFTFWFTQVLWDICTMTLTALVVIVTIACFQEDGFSSLAELSRYFLLIFIFGCSVLPFTYIASLFCKEPATGFARVSTLNLFAGMALFIVVMVMKIDVFDTNKTADLLSWIFRAFPHFSLALGLNKAYVNVASRSACEKVSMLPPILLCELVPQCCDLKPYFAWEEPGVLPEILYMTLTAIIFFSFLIIREFGLISELSYMLKSKFSKPPPAPVDSSIDDDVDAERRRILNMNHHELHAKNLVLDRVTKYYGKFLAVNQVSLCVQGAECFGLLGVNGAGKTTTFKMMTGDERISSGTAYVQGLNLKSDMNTVYKRVGYCPQFDALLEDLTGREMLRIFCLLRGVQAMRINQLSEDLARSFGFMKHLDKPTKTYSGGNKRKLSTAIAVLGTPSVIYLDEPTTGMDPAARRQLWNMVCRIRDAGKSIVLTSHSMEECEALCTRLAIMVNGEFKCIGSTQHLKNKFSKGLILKIKVRRNAKHLRNNSSFSRHADEVPVAVQLADQNINRVKEFVLDKFPEAILQEEYQGMLTFYVPLTGIKWSEIFGLMERNREQLNVEDYAISQTTLEEIFLEFAKYQREDTRDTK